MITLLLKYAKRVLTLLIVAFLLTTTVVAAKTNEYINYKVGTQVEQSIETEVSAWQQRECDVIVRVGEFNAKSGKRVYLDQVDIRWKDIPTDIPIHRDSEGHYIHEHDINLKIATKLYNELRANGINAKLQVANSRAEDLNAAARISNKSNPKL